MLRYGAAPPLDGAQPQPQLAPWQRPQDWLPMPPLLPQEQKFIGLVAVFPSNNEICLAAAGSFHVDWGDGQRELVSSPSHPSERYQAGIWVVNPVNEYNPGLSSSDRAWSHRQASTVQVRWSGPGLITPDRYRFEERNGQVVVIFEPALHNNGSWFWMEIQWQFTAINLAPTLVRHRYSYDNPVLVGSESARGYRQALVTVTPQAGQQLSALSLQDESWANSSLGCWLDVAIASPVLAALQIGED
ncbi:MAG: hypothetical protein ACKO0M_02055 [Cyanobium sp.]